MIAHRLRSFDEQIENFFGQFTKALAAESHHSLTLRLTLLLVVLHGATSPFASMVVRIVALLMLVLPPLANAAPVWWWILVSALVASNADQWEMIDNHQYLIMYWVLACVLTLGRPRDLGLNGRLLVAVSFGFAVTWKLLAGEYLNGSFFYVTFFTDGRLQNVAGVLADGGVQDVRLTGQAIRELSTYGTAGSSIPIGRDDGLLLLALAMSWAGLVVEALVAALHVLPGRRWYLARHVALMAFVAFTYLLLPVVGFGFLLAVMGFAQVDDDDYRLKGYYIVLLCFLQISLVPWRNLLAP